MSRHREFDEPRAHPWVWLIIICLFVASVPWYLPAGGPVPRWFGLPYWVVISLGASLAVAICTAWVIARYWSTPDLEDGESSEHDSR